MRCACRGLGRVGVKGREEAYLGGMAFNKSRLQVLNHVATTYIQSYELREGDRRIDDVADLAITISRSGVASEECQAGGDLTGERKSFKDQR